MAMRSKSPMTSRRKPRGSSDRSQQDFPFDAPPPGHRPPDSPDAESRAQPKAPSNYGRILDGISQGTKQAAALASAGRYSIVALQRLVEVLRGLHDKRRERPIESSGRGDHVSPSRLAGDSSGNLSDSADDHER